MSHRELSNLPFPPCCMANMIPREGQHGRISCSFQKITYFLILSSCYRSLGKLLENWHIILSNKLYMSSAGKTWRCGGLGPVDCHLSSWSEWGPCTTMCGVGGRQTSIRRRLITEQCGGTCPGGLNLKITRACPQIRCFNGGRLMHGACKCNVGYSGDCCEYTENTKKGKVHTEICITA